MNTPNIEKLLVRYYNDERLAHVRRAAEGQRPHPD